MTDIIKYDMTDIWATAGDVVAPDSAKIRAGWGVEVVPRQWWNWFENRQDQNIAYMLQKGFPEWDATTEYINNKSYVQRNGVVYKATATTTGVDPTGLVSWIRVFADYSVASNALGALTPAANTLPYFDSTSTATVAAFTSFARSLLDDTDAATMRATLSAQQSNTNLTALSGVAAAANGLPYFTGTTSMGVTTLTALGRSIIASIDAASARSVLEVDSAADASAALAAGLATKQPLSATLTTLSSVTVATNKLPYFTGTSTAATTDITTYSRSLIASVDAASARTVLSVDSSATSASNLSAGLATRQPLNANLTTLSSLSTTADTLPYFTGTSTSSLTNLTAFARTILDDPDAATVRATISVDSSATSASNLSSGLATRQPLNANLTTLAAVSSVADSMPYFTGTNVAAVTGLTATARSFLVATSQANFRNLTGTDNAANLTSGLLDLARIPTSLTGKVVDAAVSLQTARTIQGVPFNGTTNIVLPVVGQDSATGAASIPAGNTAARPATGVNGMMRYNSDLAAFEGYQAGAWSPVGAGQISKQFISSAQTVTSGALLTIPHGLGADPKLIRAVMICAVAEQGFAVGNRVEAALVSNQPDPSRGVVVFSDSTNIYLRYGSNANTLVTINNTNGNAVVLTNTSWRYELRAYA